MFFLFLFPFTNSNMRKKQYIDVSAKSLKVGLKVVLLITWPGYYISKSRGQLSQNCSVTAKIEKVATLYKRPWRLIEDISLCRQNWRNLYQSYSSWSLVKKKYSTVEGQLNLNGGLRMLPGQLAGQPGIQR